MGSRREEERNEKIIRGLMKLPPNRKCINYNSVVIISRFHLLLPRCYKLIAFCSASWIDQRDAVASGD
jgi:hypothetical protein